jgi:hypothetical protein
MACAAASSQRVVPSAPNGNGAVISVAPRDCSARAVSARNGWASSSRVSGPTAGQVVHVVQAHLVEQTGELVFHRVGQRPGHQQRRCSASRFGRQLWHQRGQAGVFALRERGLDAAARIVEDAHPGQVLRRQALRRATQVELDDFRRAGAHQEQHLDVRSAFQQTRHHAVEFLVCIGQPGQVALVDDGGAEARFGKDHHAGCRLHQVRTGA